MSRDIKDKLLIAAVVSILIFGLFAPLFTPNYGVVVSGESLYMPVPYL
jgi:hypothetical protein